MRVTVKCAEINDKIENDFYIESENEIYKESENEIYIESGDEMYNESENEIYKESDDENYDESDVADGNCNPDARPLLDIAIKFVMPTVEL